MSCHDKEKELQPAPLFPSPLSLLQILPVATTDDDVNNRIRRLGCKSHGEITEVIRRLTLPLVEPL